MVAITVVFRKKPLKDLHFAASQDYSVVVLILSFILLSNVRICCTLSKCDLTEASALVLAQQRLVGIGTVYPLKVKLCGRNFLCLCLHD